MRLRTPSTSSTLRWTLAGSLTLATTLFTGLAASAEPLTVGSVAAGNQPLQIEASLTAGTPLQGPQNLIVRLAVEPDGEVLFESRHTTELLKGALPDPAMLEDGKLSLRTRPAPAYLESFDTLWLSFDVDGWQGEAQPVFVRDGVVYALDAEALRSDLVPPVLETPGESLTKVVSSDPAVHAPYNNGLCSWNLTCAGVKGRFRWMRDGGASCWGDTAPEMPLVVVLRGNGYEEYEYDYLQNHLAANGMLTLSLDVVATTNQVIPDAQDHQDAADEAEGFLNSACFDNVIDNFTAPNAVDLGQTGLVGHSRGGETVRYLADNLFSNGKFTTRAVVSMAPTRHTSETLYGSETPSYLVLGATHDGDVDPNGVFKAHDLGGYNEYSTPNGFDLDRGMKLFLGGTHAGFSDRGNFPPAPNQRSTTQGYVNAFLRAWLLNDWQFYGGYIRGNSVPGTWNLGAPSQFSSAVARRVVDSFQNGDEATHNLTGSVSTFNMDIFAETFGNNLSTTPHASRSLRVRPSGSNAYVQWTIPEGQQSFSGYLYLSVRVGRLTGSGDLNARIGVRNGGVYSWAYLNDFGGIDDPHYFCVTNCLVGGGDTMGYMKTFRIPVGNFSGINDIDRIYLQFLGSDAVGDEFFIDNLEFSDAFVIVPF